MPKILIVLQRHLYQNKNWQIPEQKLANPLVTNAYYSSLGSATARRATSALIRAGGATGYAAFAGQPMSAFGQETTKYGFGPERHVRFRPNADIATLYSI